MSEPDELTLTIRGRRTGKRRAVRLWFAREDDVLWLRADETADRRGPEWYRNLLAAGEATVMLDAREWRARLEPSEDREATLRRLVELWRAKYGAEWVQDWYVEKGRIPVRLRLLPE